MSGFSLRLNLAQLRADAQRLQALRDGVRRGGTVAERESIRMAHQAAQARDRLRAQLARVRAIGGRRRRV